MITDSEVRDTKARTGRLLNLTFQITKGDHEGRCLWERLNLWNPSETAVEIAMRTLSAICRAVGVMTIKDSAELHDIPLRIKVGLRKNDQTGEMENCIKAFLPKNATGASAGSTSPVPKTAPPATVPESPPKEPAPAAEPSTTAVPVAPWKRK
jgi:hypothetical protein